MKKSMMWSGVVGVVSAMALVGCQKHDDAAPATPEASTTTTQQTAPEAPASSATTSDTATAPAATDALGSNTALPADQTDDMSNMKSSGDAAKPSTLPDSQSGTAEDNR